MDTEEKKLDALRAWLRNLTDTEFSDEELCQLKAYILTHFGSGSGK